MTMLTEWVMQIIVFILIGTIIELLIPNNSMKKYINIVVGLLLLVILAKPILYIFQVDVTSEINQVENTLFQLDMPESETEILVESQKKEIQAEQDAYIWNEVKSELMNEVNPTLSEKHEAQITDISFVFSEENSDNFNQIETIVVTLTSTLEEKQQDHLIEPVHIDTSDVTHSQPTNSLQHREIKSTLKEDWNVHKEKIELKWEGGAS